MSARSDPPHNLASHVRFNLVHQLHRLDDAEHLPFFHDRADVDEGGNFGRGGAIEGADERRVDREAVRRCLCDGRCGSGRGSRDWRGRDGGGPGGNGKLSLASGQVLKAKGFQTIPAGERLVVEMPGGGGFGDPKKRDRAQVARDVKLGLVSEAQAKAAYGVEGD